MSLPAHPSIQTRFLLVLFGLIGILWLSQHLFNTVLPTDSQQSMIVQGGILLILLGSLVLEDKFTKPTDAVINALSVLISVVPVYNSNPSFWAVPGIYALLVLTTGLSCILLGLPEETDGAKKVASRVLYKLATTLGKARVIFSGIFLMAVLAVYGYQSYNTGLLVLFWGIYVVLWPLKIPHILQYFIEALFNTGKDNAVVCGKVLRSDNPDILRIEIDIEKYNDLNLMVACQGDSKHSVVKPLFQQIQENRVIVTGLVISNAIKPIKNVKAGCVYSTEQDLSTIDETSLKYSKDNLSRMIGIVCEDSNIGAIHFETWRHKDCSEGLLVYCKIKDSIVYYQIIGATTKEEGFESHRQGFQVVDALQIGTLDREKGFIKFPWLPEMNTPVFLADEGLSLEQVVQPEEFALGKIPGTEVDIIADIDDMLLYHTAILGVTGTGKTEFAFDVIEKAFSTGTKVLCIDITGDYQPRLARFKPLDLSISETVSNQLSKKLFDVDTGEYKAGNEKKALQEYRSEIIEDISTSVKGFMQGDTNLGIFHLPSIHNTKATIYITEAYLTAVFNYARQNRDQHKVLIVLEEAHTVIPESKTMGISDYDAQGMIAKIGQIALQGRKYGVGLLVIAQRTATVSKTVLTQCNTVIAFSSFDQTGLEYLSNFFGRSYTNRISNLQFLEALAFGKAIKSERPVVIKLPFKRDLAEGLLEPQPADVASAETPTP